MSLKQQYEHEAYVRNLPFEATSEEISKFFEGCGDVDSVNLLKGYGGRSKGIAFVRFADAQTLTKALAKDGSNFNGRPVSVEQTSSRDQRGDREEGFGGRGRGGYGGSRGSYGGYRGGRGGNRQYESNRYSDEDDEEEKGQSGKKEVHEHEAYVTNLPFTANQDDIRDFFGREVESVNLLKGYDGRSKGIAFVRFTSGPALSKAVELDGKSLDGRALKIEKTKPVNERDRPQFNSGRGGYRGGYRGGSRYGGNYGDDRYGGDRYGNNDRYEDRYGDRYGGNNYSGDRYGGSRYGGDRFGGDRYRDDQYRGGDRYGGNRYNKNEEKGLSNESSSVYVGNLSYTTTDDSLRDFFSDCGEIKEASVSRTYEGRSKGFGHIDFASVQAAQRAVEKNGDKLDGREIRLDFSSGKKFESNRGGFEGSRGGRGGRGGYNNRD